MENKFLDMKIDKNKQENIETFKEWIVSTGCDVSKVDWPVFFESIGA